MTLTLTLVQSGTDGAAGLQADLAAALAVPLERMNAAVNWTAEAAAGLDHGDREEALTVMGRELMRSLLQASFTLDAVREQKVPQARQAVVSASGLGHGIVERGHDRTLTSVFGDVRVERLAYRNRKEPNLYLADARRRLFGDLYSMGIRALAARHIATGPLEAARDAITAGTGVVVGKRQLGELAADLATHVEPFYETRKHAAATEPTSDPLLLQADGKGIAMLAAHRKTNGGATDATHPGIKRLAEIVAVADLKSSPRTADDIMAPPTRTVVAPKAVDKWVAASLAEDIPAVIASVFDEADRRDPSGIRQRVFLVDGNKTQITAIAAQAKARKQKVPILIDFIHVAGYLRKAAAACHPDDRQAARQWADGQLLRILHGKARPVAATLKAKAASLPTGQRGDIDRAVTYLSNNAAHMDYPTALQAGWPIATGMIEGACRHVIEDRFGIAGARWSLDGAETVLKLRAVVINGDLEEFLTFYKQRQFEKIHLSRYAESSRHLLTLAA